MAIPSGAGTEVLKRATLHGNNAATTEILSGTAGHIYTILSIVYCDMEAAEGKIAMRINDGSNDIYLLYDHSVPSNGTFIWNDRLVLSEDDDLDVYNETNNGDWYLTYIDQDWT